MFIDPFRHSVDSPLAPAEACFAIVPNDSEDLPRATKAIYIGGAGDLAMLPRRLESA